MNSKKNTCKLQNSQLALKKGKLDLQMRQYRFEKEKAQIGKRQARRIEMIEARLMEGTLTAEQWRLLVDYERIMRECFPVREANKATSVGRSINILRTMYGTKWT